MRINKIAQPIDFPEGFRPDEHTPFVYSRRLLNVNGMREYIVRVYHYPDSETSRWAIVSFQGPVTTMQLPPKWEGGFPNSIIAGVEADNLVRRRAIDHNYREPNPNQFYEYDRRLPGYPMRSGAPAGAVFIAGGEDPVPDYDDESGEKKQSSDSITLQRFKAIWMRAIDEGDADKIDGAINFLINYISKYPNQVSKSFNEFVEDFVNRILDSNLRNKIFVFDKSILDKIPMTDQNREMVENHYKNRPHPGIQQIAPPADEVGPPKKSLRKLFASNWYKMAQAVPSEYIPRQNTPYIYHRRLTNNVTRVNAVYVVRIYFYPDSRSQWAVIAFNGRVLGDLRHQFKGAFLTRADAIREADALVREKMGRGYAETTISTSDGRLPGNPLTNMPTNTPAQSAPRPQRPTAPTPPAPSPQVQPAQPTQAPQVVRVRSQSEIFREWMQAIQNKSREHVNVAIKYIQQRMVSPDNFPETEAFIEEFTDAILKSDMREQMLTQFQPGYFERIPMTDENRAVVENYFAGLKGQPDDTTPKKSLRKLFAEKHWFGEINRRAAEESRGYFKYNIVSDPHETGSYNVYWKGLGEGLQIEKHNMPPDLFREHALRIREIAHEQSRKEING